MTSNKAQLGIGLGIGTKNQKGEWLEALFPFPHVDPSPEFLATLQGFGYQAGKNLTQELGKEDLVKLAEALSSSNTAVEMRDLALQWEKAERPRVLVISHLQEPPQSVPEIYLHLQLLSHRLVKPHGINLEGMFGKLPNVAWTNEGPIALDELNQRRIEARARGRHLDVQLVDKFPKMTDYVVPEGVRIGDGARIRLGAYLGKGTTVMHEGFVNFNAGTLGVSMVEGRISAGVVVGNGSDLGGGCSTMGTLSGGNKTIISLGENCLIGANAGVGIALGDRCTIEAGLYITAGSKVAVLDASGQVSGTIKARELSGKSDLLFRRNSQNGQIECLTNKSAIELNAELHANN